MASRDEVKAALPAARCYWSASAQRFNVAERGALLGYGLTKQSAWDHALKTLRDWQQEQLTKAGAR